MTAAGGSTTQAWRARTVCLVGRAAVGRSLSNLASVVKEQGDYELARSLYDEALATFREMVDETAAARVMNKQGDVARAQGDSAGARELYERSLATFRQVDRPRHREC